MNLADALDIHARSRPSHPALIEGDQVLTYAQFTRRVRRMAAWLQGLALPAGQPVGICLRDTTQHVVALLLMMAVGLGEEALESGAAALVRELVQARRDRVVRD